MPSVRLENVSKMYKDRENRSPAVLNVNFQFEQGEFIFLTGSRGAGKSTLMDLISGELSPDSGAVFVDDVNLRRMRPSRRSRYRRSIGRVSAETGLVRNQTVARNMGGKSLAELLRDRAGSDSRIQKSLGLVGMGGCEGRYPMEFTASECKRIEVARAIMHNPSILLLDEITEWADEDTVWDLLHLLAELNKRISMTIIMATNAASIINYMRRRVITLADGKLVGDVKKGRLGYID